MLFDRAFVLLCVTLSGVTAFAPQAHHSVSRVATCVPKVGVLFSEVEEATEASSTEEVAAPVVEAESAAAFDTAIYVGNISFGELIFCDVLCCNCSIIDYVYMQIISH